MAKTTRQYVFDGMEHMQAGLQPYILRTLSAEMGEDWPKQVVDRFSNWHHEKNGKINLDTQKLLQIMERFWNDAFRNTLDKTHRSIVNELVEVRNKLAHDRKFSYDDAERALDSMRRLLEAVSASEAAEKISKSRDQILRTKFDEMRRNEERKQTTGPALSTEIGAGLKSWRQVVEPHPDVATGDFQQAEFAADLAKVHNGSAPPEYSDPKEFFGRTYLTQGLSDLLVRTAKRLGDHGGDPVVELQTNFGGGKTHSMLALYHMAGGTPSADLPGLDQLFSDAGLAVPGGVKRAVLVGTSRGPQDPDPVALAAGREIYTTWGELAWQLGGEEAFKLVEENEKSKTAPGSALLEKLFRMCSPSLILIDEWVAYLRQIYRVDGLPAGTFDANLTFVQALTEAVKASPGTLLVASLPQSQIEVGGDGGQEALKILKQTFSRVETGWRPATQEESYEIVRRRLFKEIPADNAHHRDNTLKQFAKLYRENPDYFPQGCSEEEYRRKLEKAYPIHPELFDQLYQSWGALEKFQRTRGVLRLMAQVIHELWMGQDPSVVIMPGSVTVNSARVQPELLHYLDVVWQGIIANDIDGTNSTPFKIDQNVPNLNRVSATRRVARTIFLATAPMQSVQNKGLDDKQINLGIVQPGEKPTVFGDALRRLSNSAQFMHSDMGRHWYSVSPSMNRMAADRAEQIEEPAVLLEIDKALSTYMSGLTDRGHFEAVQVAPDGSAEVPDEPGGVRAVVLGVKYTHSAGKGSESLKECKDILLHRGNAPRVYRNVLVFIAPEGRQIDQLKLSVRRALGWEGIVREADRLNLTQRDLKLAEAQAKESRASMKAALISAWNHVIYPHQNSPQEEVEWSASKIAPQDGVLASASKKLVSEEGLMPEFGPNRLERSLRNHIWHEKPHLSLRDIWEYTNRFVYLPRLKNRSVLSNTVQSAIGGMLPGAFAYAEAFDENDDVYRGLAICKSGSVHVVVDNDSLIVDADVAERYRQKQEPVPEPVISPEDAGEGAEGVPKGPSPESEPKPPEQLLPTRFRGTVIIDADRPAKSMSHIVEAIIEQLTMSPDSEVKLLLEIDAEVPSGLDKSRVRTLLENSNTLGFTDRKIE
ncbi:DUF499 domain-containing protein [Ruegeria lacuscaerulensis]|uniref:DUF499 domain-containing protein n=1 Tax=Ruegeria lacuscaerulensis TaxID=55218 RepID=UPI00147DE4DC|nr:DUF499 domain-containing protein [Ruegeria lacuscaerulensis]